MEMDTADMVNITDAALEKSYQDLEDRNAKLEASNQDYKGQLVQLETTDRNLELARKSERESHELLRKDLEEFQQSWKER